MNLFKTAIAGAMLAAAATSAQAIPTFTAPGGAVYDPIGRIDWSAGGTAWTSDFNQTKAIAGTPFAMTTSYAAFAKGTTGIGTGGASNVDWNIPNLIGGTPPPGGNDFELTVFATFNEVATCLGGGAFCGFTVTSGSFTVYIDETPDAQEGAAEANLSDYTNGNVLFSGTINPGPAGGFFAFSNNGAQSFFGQVTYTNPAYITPALVATTAGTEIKIGPATTSWQRFGFLPADGCAVNGSGDNICRLNFQADGNQSFAVPEPSSLALLGLAVAGIGFAGRRARKAV